VAAPLAALSAVAGLLPALAADPRFGDDSGLAVGAFRVVLGIGPLCVALGALTPMLVDRFSGGDGARAGRAYAVNVVGCILGPLVAGFALLPALAERWCLLLLAAPVAALAAGAARAARGAGTGAVAAAAIALVALTRGHETLFTPREVRRDYTATVVAAGSGLEKHLLVNGIGMTQLSPATKMMAHLPLAMLGRPPRNVLVICFGMGTSFRSAMRWGASVTAVELVPSVPALFGFYHADGPALLQHSGARVVVDDGRRFLERTRDRFDLVLVDPPPPPEAAGSSLLYSREFYTLVRQRLATGGLLQQWVPGATGRRSRPSPAPWPNRFPTCGPTRPCWSRASTTLPERRPLRCRRPRRSRHGCPRPPSPTSSNGGRTRTGGCRSSARSCSARSRSRGWQTWRASTRSRTTSP
jgi:hypothetical protein